MQSSSQIIITNKPASSLSQAGCPSCRPTNSVKALKGHYIAHRVVQVQNVSLCFIGDNGDDEDARVCVCVCVALLFALVGFAQMTQWALGKHKNYRAEFKDYPRARKAIIPFIIWIMHADCPALMDVLAYSLLYTMPVTDSITQHMNTRTHTHTHCSQCWQYCKTPIVRVPFISRISRPSQPRENNGSLIYILAAIS